MIDSPATAPSGSSFTVNVHAVDYWGNVSPGTDIDGIVLVVDSSSAYWPDSHAGGGPVSIVDGVGTVTVSMPAGFGYVTLSLENPGAANADTDSVTTVHVAESEDVFSADSLALSGPGEANVRITLTVTPARAGSSAAPAAATTTSCDNLPPTFLRDVTEAVWTVLGKTLLRLADIRVGAFTCTQPATGTAVVVYRVTAASDSAPLLVERANDMVARRASGASLLENAVQPAAEGFGLPGMAIRGEVDAVSEAGGSCAPSGWSPWSGCSVDVCGDTAGAQVRSRTCLTEAGTQPCAATQCGDCSVDHGGCSPNADCALDDARQVVCTCDTAVFVGTGDACLDRTDAQRAVAGVEIVFAAGLSTVAQDTAQRARRAAGGNGLGAQGELLAALGDTAAAALSIARGRLVASAVRPVTESSFSFSVLVLPPALLDEPTAAEIEAAVGTAPVFQRFQTSFNGVELTPSATESFGRMYDALSAPAADPTSPANGTDAGASTGATALAGWTVKDTVTLLAVLTALSILLAGIFEAVYLQTRATNAAMQWQAAGPPSDDAATGQRAADASLVGGAGSHDGSILFGLPLEEDGRGWTPSGFSPSGVDDFEPFPT